MLFVAALRCIGYEWLASCDSKKSPASAYSSVTRSDQTMCAFVLHSDEPGVVSALSSHSTSNPARQTHRAWASRRPLFLAKLTDKRVRWKSRAAHLLRLKLTMNGITSVASFLRQTIEEIWASTLQSSLLRAAAFRIGKSTLRHLII